MKRTIISGIFALLFLGGLLFAQSAVDITPAPRRPPVPPIPPRLVEARYYEGEAIVQYKNGDSLMGVRGTVRVWVERDVFKNLFRGRYEICYNTDGPLGVCEAITYSSWIKGEEHNGVWIIRQSNLQAILGPGEGFVKLDEGRRTITMKLKLMPVGIPEPAPPLTALE